jgi:xanthine permease
VERLRAGTLVALAIQHVLVMYAGAVAVPLIVGAAFGLPKDQLASLIDADLFACGLATIVQSLGIGPFGIRLPVMMGASFVCVAPILAAAHTPGTRLGEVFGGIIVAGVFGLVVTPLAGRIVRLFPPVVTGSVITVIGLSLMTVAVGWAGGGVGARDFGALKYLGVGTFVLIVILVLLARTRGFVQNVAVLLGIVAGYAVTVALGWPSFTGLEHEPWVALVVPFQFGPPVFTLGTSLAMCLVMLVTMIESTGMFLALGELTGRSVDDDDLRRGLRADALGTLLGGLFNAFPYTSYSQNVGLVGITGVRSRWVCVGGGVLLLALGVLPKLSFVVASIPPCVLGGAGFIMFGMVAATGIRILSAVDYANRHNLVLVALAVGIGMVPTLAPTFFAAMPASVGPIFNDGIVLAALVAVLLNQFFSRFALLGTPQPESAA